MEGKTTEAWQEISTKCGEEIPDGSFVYFLVNDGECVYVGQTRNLRSRLRRHRSDKAYDSVYYLHVSADMRLSVESEWIAKLKPIYNGKPGRPAVGKEPMRSFRVSDEDWDLFKRAAHASELSLARWIILTLRAAARRILE